MSYFTRLHICMPTVIEREQARERMRYTAATILAIWWRRSRNKLTRRQQKIDRHALRREFLEYKVETLQEVEDLQSMRYSSLDANFLEKHANVAGAKRVGATERFQNSVTPRDNSLHHAI